jgi:hypothetical protein
MPTPIQRGELVERLRRFMGIVGRLPLVLDEVCIPVVSVAELNVPPYRREASNWQKRCSQGAVVGQLSACGVHLPATSAGAARIQRVTYENTSAAAIQLALMYSQNTEGLGGYSLQGGCVDIERPNPVSSGVLKLTPVREYFAAAAALPSGTSEMIDLVDIDVNASLTKEIDVMIYPGYGLASWCLTANTAMGSSFAGTYYPTAQLG